jgi:signal transduction histidine kinase
MRLATRFRITGAVSVAAILLLAAVLAWSLRETRRAGADADFAGAMTKEQYERALLRDDYLLSRGVRPFEQWKERTATLKRLLAEAVAEFQASDEREVVAEMTELFERSNLLFKEIASRDRDVVRGEPQRALAAELRERSTATLRIVGHDLYARARQLEGSAAARVKLTQTRTTLTIVALVAAAFFTTFFNTRMALITLERRVLRLRDGAERVASGSLDHRIGIQGNDELAELGSAFDRMTARLQRSYTAVESSNRELEAFSYAVSHDLRAPLRSVAGFSQAVLEDYGPQLDEKGRQYLEMAAESAREMGQLIDDLLSLSRVSRVEMARRPVDLSALARSVMDDLRAADPDRRVEAEIAPELLASGDPTLLRLVLQNLLSNSWKFTSRHPTARITFGRTRDGDRDAFFVTDDGAGFDMAYVEKIFSPFQRLHRASEFPGTGIGLATVSRIVRRHGGEAWARGEVEKGATVFFTLPAKGEEHDEQSHPVG